MEIKQGKVKVPLKLVIYGTEGIGKSTLASNAPDPLFIDIEGGTNQLNVKRLDPAPINWEEFLNQIDYVIKNPDCCKTLVIDTLDAAEVMGIDHVLEKERLKAISDEFWKGRTILGTEFNNKVINRLNRVVENGINVVVLAHSQIKRFENPEEMGTYDRYELKLTKPVASSIKEWCDSLLFLNYKTQVVTTRNVMEKNKAIGGKRVIHTTHHPAWDAKNRFGLEEELPLTYSSIKAMFDQDYPEINLDVTEDDPVFDEPSVTVKTTGEMEVHDREGNVIDDPDFVELPPDRLYELMEESHVTEEQIINVLVQIGQLQNMNQTLNDVGAEYIQENIIDVWDNFLAYLRSM